jgi:hypothetical protein
MTTKSIRSFVVLTASVAMLACKPGASSEGVVAAKGGAAASPSAGSRPQVPSSRAMAWFLGKNLSLAALGRASGAPQQAVDGVLEKARILANATGTPLPDLPAMQGSRAKDSAAALDYLLNAAGKGIQGHLEQRYDAQHAAVFEMAVKSNVLVMLYAPGDSLGTTTMAAISGAGQRSGLTELAWALATSQVWGKASHDDVKAAVIRMQEDIESQLKSEGGAPSAR